MNTNSYNELIYGVTFTAGVSTRLLTSVLGMEGRLFNQELLARDILSEGVW